LIGFKKVIPRFKPVIGFPELLAAIRPARKDDVEHFEKKFARLVNQKYAVAFPYGRTGLMVLLESLGLKDKEIICPAYTCIVVPHAITYSGNVPVFIDCEQGGFNMDLNLVEKAINEKTGAIIATSLFGYPVNLDRLDEIRNHHPHIYVIQDCAHSFAVKWTDRLVQKEGIAALFGLNISKTLTSIFGGIITTDDEKFFLTLKKLRDYKLKKSHWKKELRRLLYLLGVCPTFWEPIYGIVNRMERSGIIDYFVKYYDERKIDMPSDYLQQMASIEARVGTENIRRYVTITKNRREAADYYFEHLDSEVNFKLPPKIESATYSHFVVQVPDRNAWLQKSLRHALQLGWLIEYNIPEMHAYGGHGPGEFPVATSYARNTINLPVWGGRKLAERVVRKIRYI
jgi:dTDP-4-amino-4,6-dideoxygalactose transaminase